MKDLKDLIASLSRVLVRYHDYQNVGKLADVDILAITETDTSIELYKSSVERLIAKCTQSYVDRAPLLNFILSQSLNLKSLLTQQTSFTPEQLEANINSLTQFLTDIVALLKTKKGTMCLVSNIQMPDGSGSAANTQPLSGLDNSSRIRSSLCISGQFLTEELKISGATTAEELRGVATKCITELQDSLLVLETVPLKAQVTELKNENAALRLTMDELKAALEAANTQIQARDAEIADIKLKTSTAAVAAANWGLFRAEAGRAAAAGPSAVVTKASYTPGGRLNFAPVD